MYIYPKKILPCLTLFILILFWMLNALNFHSEFPNTTSSKENAFDIPDDDSYESLNETSTMMLKAETENKASFILNHNKNNNRLKILEHGTRSANEIIINEIMFNSTSGKDWIELYNAGSSYQDIDGWVITNEIDNNFTIPDIPEIPPSGYVVLHFYSGINDTFFGESQPNTLNIYFFDSNISWVKYTIDPLLAGAWEACSGDIDDDGNVDIVAVGTDDNDVIWYEAPDDPTQIWTKHYIDANLDGARRVDIFDIDTDGDLDVIAAGFFADDLVWYEAPLDPTQNWSKHYIDDNIDSVQVAIVGDINNDSNPDVVGATYLDKMVYWYKAPDDPTQNWTKYNISFNPSPIDAFIADLDYDGNLDVIASEGQFGDSVVWYEAPDDPEDSWSEHFIGTLEYPFDIDVYDIDLDGDLDIATNADYWDVLVLESPSDPTGNWIKHTIESNLEAARCVKVRDLNNDNNPDIVAVGGAADAVIWYESTGNLTDTWKKHYVDTNINSPAKFELVDINDDGYLDIVMPSDEGNSIFWYRQIIGNPYIFKDIGQVSLYINNSHTNSTIRDFIAWGKDPEINSSNAISAGIWSLGDYINTSGFNIGDTIGRDKESTDTEHSDDWEITCGIDASHPTPGGQNLDGILNYFNISSPTSQNAGSAFNIQITAYDPWNYIIQDYKGKISFTSTDPNALLPIDYGNNWTNGSATFSITFNTTGLNTFTISNGSISFISNLIDIKPGNLKYFFVSAPPPQTVHIPFNVQIMAYDAWHNTKTDYFGNISFITTDFDAVIPLDMGTGWFNGESTFSVTFNSTGVHNFTVFDGDIINTSKDITVFPGTLDHFIITTSSPQVVHNPFNVQIIAYDVWDNIKTDYKGVVNFSSTDIEAELPYDNGSIWSSGVSTFSIKFNTTGIISFNITDDNISAMSIPIVVNPDVLFRIIITNNVTSVVVGTTFVFNALGYDQYNNEVDVSYNWSTNVGIITNKTYTAQTHIGHGYINASFNGVIGSIKINITPDILKLIEVIPNYIEIIGGQSHSFSAIGYDIYNNSVYINPIWDTNIGSINEGFFIAYNINDSGYVRASVDDIFGEAIVIIFMDSDIDNIPDFIDTDDDNDGHPDEYDAFPLNNTEWLDTDKDGIGNNADLDDDNDGYHDNEDAYPLNPDKWKESTSNLSWVLFLMIVIIIICIIFLIIFLKKKGKLIKIKSEVEK